MSNSRSLTLISTARLGSTRLKNKMLKKFWNGNTMFSLLIQKMKQLVGKFPFEDCAIALNPRDESLVKIATEGGMKIIARSDNSVKSAALKDIYDFVDEIPTDYIMWVNGSSPFWSPSTAARAARLFYASSKIDSITTVVKRKNWFWDENGAPINQGAATGKTQDSSDIFESTHSFHIFPKATIKRFGAYWSLTKNDPYLFEIQPSECPADVDTAEDFDLADAIMMWRETKGER